MSEMDFATACRINLDATESWTADERRAVLEQLGHYKVYVTAVQATLDKLLTNPDEFLKDPDVFLRTVEVVERHIQSLKEKSARVRALQVQASQVLDKATR